MSSNPIIPEEMSSLMKTSWASKLHSTLSPRNSQSILSNLRLYPESTEHSLKQNKNLQGLKHTKTGNPESERGSTTQNVAGPSAPSEPRDQVRICPMPVTSSSSMSFRDQILEAILHIMEEAENMQPARSERSSRIRRRANSRRVRNSGSNRRTGRGRRPQGRRQRRRASDYDSDASMYEVVDVDYEKISDLKAPPEMDWRLIPRYELSRREAARQERELYFLLTSESKNEGVERPKVGSPSCCICHENAATRVVIPCGHRCLCQPCAYYIATNRSSLGGAKLPKRCPMCQAAIGLMVRLR